MKTTQENQGNSQAARFVSDAAVLCVTSSVVLYKHALVRFVCHNDVDLAWHFHQGGPVDPKDRLTVALELVLHSDATLKAVSDLGLGWYAERDSLDSPWRKRSKPPDEIS